MVTPNQKVKVTLQLLYAPEYLTENGRLIINDNNLKAHGRITKVYYDSTIKKFEETSSSMSKLPKQKRKNSVPTKIEGSLVAGEECKEGEMESLIESTSHGRKNRNGQQQPLMALQQEIVIEKGESMEEKKEQEQVALNEGKKEQSQSTTTAEETPPQ